MQYLYMYDIHLKMQTFSVYSLNDHALSNFAFRVFTVIQVFFEQYSY